MTREEREYFYRKLQKMFAEWAASHETTPDVNNALIKTFADRYMGSVTGQQPLPQELFRVFLSELKLPSGGESNDILISNMRKDIENAKKHIGSMNFGPSLEEQETISGAIAALGNVVGDTDNGDMDVDLLGNMSILSYLKFMNDVLDVRELEHMTMAAEDTIASILYNNVAKARSLEKLVGSGNWGGNFADGDDLSVCVRELGNICGSIEDWSTKNTYNTLGNAIDVLTNSINSLSERISALEAKIK